MERKAGFLKIRALLTEALFEAPIFDTQLRNIRKVMEDKKTTQTNNPSTSPAGPMPPIPSVPLEEEEERCVRALEAATHKAISYHASIECTRHYLKVEQEKIAENTAKLIALKTQRRLAETKDMKGI